VGGGMGWAIVFVATRMWGFGAWAESIRLSWARIFLVTV
jgi:hypothetical protein